jgi:CDP-diacylglycerol--serine O-phosphatidyltransferase
MTDENRVQAAEDADMNDSPRPRRKGIYVLPNAITLAALFGGFYSIVMAMNGRFDQAALGVFCAMVLDSLDGRVARMTNTQSSFGEQMDSLSDMVSFGCRPRADRLRVVAQGTRETRLGGGLRVLCRRGTAPGALQHQHRHRRQALFPGAAQPGCGCAGDWTDLGHGRRRLEGVSRVDWLTWTAFAVTLYAGLTMVTNVPFYSFKVVGLKKTVPFIVIVAIALGDRDHQSASADRALRDLLCVWPVGLCGLRLAEDEGQAGQRHCHVDR